MTTNGASGNPPGSDDGVVGIVTRAEALALEKEQANG